MPRDFEEALKWGQEGEQIVGRYLMRRGAKIMPLYQFDNHGAAPVVVWGGSASEVQMASPDFICWRSGKQYFAEAKRKRRWVHYPRARRGLETGFNARLMNHYTEIEAATGAPVWVFFLHESSGHPKSEPSGLFCGLLSKLTQNVRIWDGRSANDSSYVTQPEALFPQSSLSLVCSLDELAQVAA